MKTKTITAKLNVKAKTFCALPWLALEIRPEGTMAVCCNSRQVLRGQEGRILKAQQDSLELGLQSPTRLELQASLVSGRQHPNCDRCWEEEKSGLISRRLKSNHIYSTEIATLEKNVNAFDLQPKALELGFSNVCNQKCRICGPASSTLWSSEMAKIYPQNSPHLEVNWGANNPELWKKLEQVLPSVTRIDLFGGEPFLIPECERLLALAIERGVAGQIQLQFSTNGSIFPDRLVSQFLVYFQKVSIHVSIDGVGKQFEYQRHPARWDRVLEVYRKWKSTGYFAGIVLSVSALNIFDLPDYLRFWNESGEQQVHLNPVFSPSFLSINILPPDLKNAVAAHLFGASNISAGQKDSILKLMIYMHQVSRDDLWNQFIQYTRTHDQHRKEDFTKTFPDYSRLMAKCLAPDQLLSSSKIF